MTAFWIAFGVTSAVLLGLFAHRIGVHVGWQRGFQEGFELAEDLADGDTDEAYFRHYGGQIEAGRRREN